MFQQKKPNPEGTVIRGKLLIVEVQSQLNAAASGEQANANSLTHWCPLMAQMVKFNTDVALNTATGRGFVSIACRDSSGSLITATSFCLYASSSIVAEAYGLHAAMQLAISLNFQEVCFESDNKSIIEACQGIKVFREVRGIVADVISMVDKFRRCVFSWIPRRGNEVAHVIAKLASNGQLQGNWLVNLPQTLRQALTRDSQVETQIEGEPHL